MCQRFPRHCSVANVASVALAIAWLSCTPTFAAQMDKSANIDLTHPDMDLGVLASQIQQFKDDGGTMMYVNTYGWQEHPYKVSSWGREVGDIYVNSTWSPDWLTNTVIDVIQSKGLKVAIRPHMEVEGCSLIDSYISQDFQSWCNGPMGYGNLVNHYAQIAEAKHVDLLALGNEMMQVTTRYNYLTDVVNGAKSRYSGPVTYAALGRDYTGPLDWQVMGPAGQTAISCESTGWYGQLDSIGINCYYQLTDQMDPTVGQLKEVWRQYGKRMDYWWNSLPADQRKPVEFTEWGYPSMDGCNKAPTDYDIYQRDAQGHYILDQHGDKIPRPIDKQEQADCYEAMFSQMWQKYPWFKAVHVFAWPDNEDAGDNPYYSPQNKLAESVMANYYSNPTKYWSGAGASNWDDSHWSDSATGPFTGSWSDKSKVEFVATTGQDINVNGTRSISGLTFHGPNYRLLGGTLALNVGDTTNGTVCGAAVDTGGYNVEITSTITGPGDLAKIGNGLLTLNGTNNYTGGTTITEGALKFGSSVPTTGSIIINTNGSLVVAGATNAFATVMGCLNSGKIDVDSPGTLALGADSYEAIDMGNYYNLSLGAYGGSRHYSGAMTPYTGTYAPSSTNAYRFGGGGSTLYVDSNLGNGPGGAARKVITRGDVYLTGTNTYTGGTTVKTGELRFSALSAVPTTGKIFIDQEGSLAAWGAYSYASDWLASGRIDTGSTGALAIATGDYYWNIDFNTGGYQHLSLGAHLDTTLYSGSITPYGNTYRLGGGEGTLTVNYGLGGSNDLIVTGNLIFKGASSYTGKTDINYGMLRLANGNNRLPTTTALTLANRADTFLQLYGCDQTVASLSGGGRSGGDVMLGSSVLTVGDANDTTYAGAISGAGSLVKQGAGQLILSGSNTYTGGTTINAGKVRFLASAVPSTGSILINSGGTLLADGAYGPGGWMSSGLISGSSWGTLALTSNNSDAISFGGHSTLRLGAVGNYTYSGQMTPDASVYRFGGGGGTLTVASNLGGERSLATYAPVILTGANTYTGITTICYDTLQVGDGGTTGTLGAGNVTINSGATLAFNRSDAVTVSNSIDGSGGSVVKNGAGTLTLSGTNTYTGGTTINAGSLKFNSSVPSGTNNIKISSGGALLANGAYGSAQAWIDSGKIYNNSSYTGALALTAGTTGINLNSTSGSYPRPYLSIGSIASTAGNPTTGYTLGGTITLPTGSSTYRLGGGGGTLSVTNSLSSSGTKNLIVGGNVNLNGSGNHKGTTTITAGNLKFSSSTNLATRSITIGSGGALLANGAYGTAQLWISNDKIDAGASSIGALALTAANSVALTLNATGHVYPYLSIGSVASTPTDPTTGYTLSGTFTPASTATAYRFGGGGGTLTVSSDLTAGIGLATNGNVTLTGAKAYTGATTVNAGTLRLGSTGTINSSSGVTINAGGTLLQNSSTALTQPITFNGGTLGGTGTYTIPTTVTNYYYENPPTGTDIYRNDLNLGNGHLSPGDPLVKNGIGTLTINGSLVMAPESVLDFDFGTTAGVCDLIQLDRHWVGTDEHGNDIWAGTDDNLHLNGTINIHCSGTLASGDYTIMTGLYPPQLDGGLEFGSVPLGHHYSYTVNSGQNYSVIVHVAPEPGTVTSLTTGLIASLLAHARRKRRQHFGERRHSA
jgi:autotransporter-associated beta strand protein